MRFLQIGLILFQCGLSLYFFKQVLHKPHRSHVLPVFFFLSTAGIRVTSLFLKYFWIDLLILPLALFFVFFFFKDQWLRKILILCFFCVLYYLLHKGFVLWFYRFWSYLSPERKGQYYQYITFLLFINQIFVILLFAAIHFEAQHFKLPLPDVLFLMINLLCLFICLLITTKYDGFPDTLSRMLFLLCLMDFGISISTIPFYNLLQQYIRQDTEKEYLHSQIQNQQIRSEEGQSIYDSFKTLQHDTRHFVQNVSEYITEGDREKMQTEMDTFKKELSSIISIEPSGCDEVDATLMMKARELNRHGIYFYCQVCDLRDIVLEPYDLNSIVMNLLDNAAKAIKASDVPFKYIDFRISYLGDVLNVLCVNPISETSEFYDPKAEEPVKTSPGKGLGIRIIQTITEKYHGLFSLYVDKKTYRAIVSFPHTP